MQEIPTFQNLVENIYCKNKNCTLLFSIHIQTCDWTTGILRSRIRKETRVPFCRSRKLRWPFSHTTDVATSPQYYSQEKTVCTTFLLFCLHVANILLLTIHVNENLKILRSMYLCCSIMDLRLFGRKLRRTVCSSKHFYHDCNSRVINYRLPKSQILNLSCDWTLWLPLLRISDHAKLRDLNLKFYFRQKSHSETLGKKN